MNTEAISLWGELPLEAAMRTPASILREQATALAKATNGLLNGEVIAGGGNKGRQSLMLNIVAPVLNNYSYQVLFARHEVFLYPVDVLESSKELLFKCENESQFIAAVREILSSDQVHKVIASLLSQSRDAVAADPDSYLPF